MVSFKRIKNIIELIDEKGIDFVKSTFNLKESTIERYLREYKTKQFGQERTLNARALMLDIEMSSVMFRLWRSGKQYVSPYDQVNNQFCICWVGRWLDTGECIGSLCTPEEAKIRSDYRVLAEMNKALQQAEIVVGHNINKYDLPTAVAKFVHHDLPPVSIPYTIDTYSEARKLRFGGNGLDYLLKSFGFSGKLKTDKQLWIDSENGDINALERMFEYCKQDVNGNINLYKKLRPYMKSHPNIALLNQNDGVCPVCESKNFSPYKSYHTGINSYEQFRCDDCGTIFRSGNAIKWREQGSEKFRSSAK